MGVTCDRGASDELTTPKLVKVESVPSEVHKRGSITISGSAVGSQQKKE